MRVIPLLQAQHQRGFYLLLQPPEDWEALDHSRLRNVLQFFTKNTRAAILKNLWGCGFAIVFCEEEDEARFFYEAAELVGFQVELLQSSHVAVRSKLRTKRGPRKGPSPQVSPRLGKKLIFKKEVRKRE